MGQVQQSKQHFLKNWQKVDSRESRIFGCEIEVYTNQMEEVAVVHKVYQSEMHYQKELKRLEQYQLMSQMPGLIRLLDIQKEEESTLCSNLFKIDAIFEYGSQLPSNLPWYQFLQQIIHTLIELQNREKYHGDLRPQSFMYTNQVKLLLPNVDQYNRFLSGFEEYCYLSPELFFQLGRKVFKPEYNKEKSEVFTIGLVCLELMLSEPIQQIYDFQEYQINQEVLNDMLSRANNKLISRMLSMKVEDRPNYLQIYEESIVELMQQSINNNNKVTIQSNPTDILNEHAIEIQSRVLVREQQSQAQSFIMQSTQQHPLLCQQSQQFTLQSCNFKDTNPTLTSMQQHPMFFQQENQLQKQQLKSNQENEEPQSMKKVHPFLSQKNSQPTVKLNANNRSMNQTPSQQIQTQQKPQIPANFQTIQQSQSSQQQVQYSTQVPQQANSLQYLAISQSPNHRYSQKSQQSSVSKHQSIQPTEYAFLHEQVHVPFNPGSDFLDSSRQKEQVDFVSPTRSSQRPSSKLKDISNKKSKTMQTTTTISSNNTNNTTNINKQIVNKKPQLLKSQRPQTQMRSKSPNVKKVPQKK
ncbi:unnamed protein product [Paramecium sonneborni]|uniref:Protein kinase domain-containing protein n=1 Tax=Paramecium sonneborni TaxID=65129 RepID=A0A8S1R911_9CILI|nr:unnamed protein product [Paramecium sonneborni]